MIDSLYIKSTKSHYACLFLLTPNSLATFPCDHSCNLSLWDHNNSINTRYQKCALGVKGHSVCSNDDAIIISSKQGIKILIY